MRVEQNPTDRKKRVKMDGRLTAAVRLCGRIFRVPQIRERIEQKNNRVIIRQAAAVAIS